MKLFRPPALPCAIAACGLVFVFRADAGAAPAPTPPETRWTMINVSPKEQQADCHLVEFPDGSRVLIDIGDAGDAPGSALAYLRQREIDRIDLVVISHFHQDHYGRLLDLIDAGTRVGRVAGNLPASREVADREKSWGMDWDGVQSMLLILRDKGIPYFTPKAGEKLVELAADGVSIGLEVVCLYDGVNTPVGRTYVNDTSIILRLSHGSVRALFTGDLDAQLGRWLAGSDVDLAADLLKVPHHGCEGNPPNQFYDRVNPKMALIPVSRALWHSPRCMRVRNYLGEHQIPAFVSGIHGNVTAILTAKGFSVMPALDP